MKCAEWALDSVDCVDDFVYVTVGVDVKGRCLDHAYVLLS